MLQRVHELAGSGVQAIALLALNDDGAPAFDHTVAEILAGFGVPAFACTPDKFPELMAAAIQRQDLFMWTASQGIATAMAGGKG
jgi:hypothetical protein